MVTDRLTREKTLDPESWGDFRALGHRMVEDIADYLENIRDRPVWQAVPDEVAATMQQPVPVEGAGEEAAYDEALRNVLPYNMANVHPRFWGWVMGSGAPIGVLGDFLASALNSQLGGADHMPSRVELQVVEWCKEMLGYAPDASGVLTSGGSMANLYALAVARHCKAGWDVREEGLAGHQDLVTYASTEAHSSIQRAIEALGMGNRNLRRVAVDSDLRLDARRLREAIQQDLSAGRKPICVVANVGATNAGSIDPLPEIAEVCREFDLWFHVDGAFGAMAYLSQEFRPALAGMELADSLALDLHKWGYLPFAVGCVLVRDAESHRRTFTLRPDYLKQVERGASAGPIWFSDYGLELTREFKALKVWMALKAYGTRRLGELIQQNIDQARYLGELVERSPQLELLAPVPLNTVCFRYVREGLSEIELDELNEEILLRIQESGEFLPSATHVAGHYAIRVSITNHRSRFEDFDALAEAVERTAEEVLGS
ncbi:MAG: pyridoxal-dependent decarboxylase [Dehalococcoidia bacterium]